MHVRARAGLLALSVLAGCQPPPPSQLLNREQLRLQVQALASTAAEADLMALQVGRGTVGAPFAWVHQQALSGEVGKAADALTRPAPQELRSAQQPARDLAAQLQDAINGTAQSLGSPEALQALHHRLAALQAQAQALERLL